jgi:hypothetical protein
VSRHSLPRCASATSRLPSVPRARSSSMSWIPQRC